MVKNLPATTGQVRDEGWIPGSGRSPGGGHGNPLQYSWLENPMDRGDWRAPWGHKELDTTEATEDTHTKGTFILQRAAGLRSSINSLKVI